MWFYITFFLDKVLVNIGKVWTTMHDDSDGWAIIANIKLPNALAERGKNTNLTANQQEQRVFEYM